MPGDLTQIAASEYDITMIKLRLKLLFLLSIFFATSPQLMAKTQSLSDRNLCLSEGQKASTETVIDACLSAKQTLKDNKNRDGNNGKDLVLIDLKLIDLYAHHGDKATKGALLSSVEKSPLLKSDPEVAYLWHRQKGLSHLHHGKYESANEHLDQAYAIAESQNELRWLAMSSNDLGLVHYKLKDYYDALAYYKISLAYKEQLGNPYFIGTTLNNLGLINKALGDLEQAVNYYESALKHFLLYTEEENFSPRVFNNLSHLYEDLAVIYTLSKRKPKSHYFSQRLVASFDNKLTPVARQRAYKNLAFIYSESGDTKMARDFLDKAINAGESSTRYMDEIAYIEGKIYFLKKDFAKAKYFGNQALLAVKESGNQRVLAEIHRLLFQTHAALNENDEALGHLEQLLGVEETLLRGRYEANIGIVKEQIKNEQLQRNLVEEQLENERNDSRIQRLTNQLLIAGIIVILMAFTSFFIYLKKRKEKEALLASIASHREKLLLLSAAQEAQDEQDPSSESEAFDAESFRTALVEVMLDSLALWEKSTRSTKIELAEQSQIWKVSIDSGRLRTRSLDKYLSINKLPANPRWKNVVRSAHFVLSECELAADDRQQLNKKLEGLMAYIKQLSLEQAP